MSNFFKDMRQVEQTVYKNYQYSELCREVFMSLVGFLESSEFTQSEALRFILLNWRSTSLELANKWNSERAVEKSVNTFRSQVSTLSRQLYFLFGIDFAEAFIDDDTNAISVIKEKIEVIQEANISFDDEFISEVGSVANPYSETSYEVDECQKEIELLAKLSKHNVFDMLDGVSPKKLAFIRRTLNTPILINKSKSVNLDKLKIISKLRKEERISNGVSDKESAFISGIEFVELIKKRAFEDVDDSTCDDSKVEKIIKIYRLFERKSVAPMIDGITPEEAKVFLRELEQHQRGV